MRALGAIIVLLVVVIGAAAAVILSGPTEVTVVRDRVRSILSSNLGDSYKVDVGRAIIDVDPVLGLVVQVDKIEVHDSEASLVASVPSVRMAIDPLALLRLRVDVSNVELTDAVISFVRADDGAVYLGNSGTAHAAARRSDKPPPNVMPNGPTGGFPDLFGALQVLDRGMEPPIEAAVRTGFQHLSLVDATIDVWDAPQHLQRRFAGTDFTIDVDPKTGGLNANFATSGYGGRWTATLEREIDPAGGRTMSAVFSQLTLADVLPGLGDDNGPMIADVPLYGRASIRFDKAGEVAAASVRLDLGAGTFKFGETRETVLLDEATVKLRWDLANKVLLVDPSTFFFGDTRAVVSGSISPQGDPESHRYSFELHSDGAVLSPRDSPARPLVAQRIQVSGVADLAAKLITFDNATILAQDASIAAAGSIGFDGATPSIAMAASFSPMSVDALKQMWIPFIAPGARRWVLDHIQSGRITAGRFEAAIPAGVIWSGKHEPLPEDALRLDFHLEDVAFTTFGELPPIINASGNAVLAGSTFGVDLEAGEVKVPSGRTVTVTAGAFAVANTAPRNPDAVIAVQLSGDAGALAEIANAKPLYALDRRKIDPAGLTGAADANVSIQLPLRPGLTEADVDWKVTVNATNLASASPLEGRKVTEANVAMAVTRDNITIKGKAKFDGVPADVRMDMPLAGTAAGGAQQVRLSLDDAARKRLGIGLADILAGTVGTTVSNLDDGRKGQHYILDLKRARLTLPGLGWTKGVGVAATLSFDLRPTDSGYVVEKIVLDGDGFGFQGSALLDSTFGLQSADINSFALRQGDNLAFKLTRSKSGYIINATGSSFDLRSFIVRVRERNQQDVDAPDLTITAKIDNLIGFNQETLQGGNLSLASVRGVVQKVDFDGSLSGAGVSLSYVDAGDVGTLDVSAADAGRVTRFLDLYTRFAGGALKLVGQRKGAGAAMVGTFDMSNFDVLNEPVMKNVVSTQASNGPTGYNSSRVHFDRMVAGFRKSGSLLTIGDALLRGAAVGATFSGRYDLASTNISISGTYLPNYAFNNAFSHIPIFGLVLGGGFREGLVGITFKIEGSLANPQVYINPLSAVAPGIFRKIFEFQ
jgi:hypothetical protein